MSNKIRDIPVSKVRQIVKEELEPERELTNREIREKLEELKDDVRSINFVVGKIITRVNEIRRQLKSTKVGN